MPRTISSGTLSSGSSIADAEGCKSSGLCESYIETRDCAFVKEVRIRSGSPYRVSFQNQSIAEHFEQKCLSDNARCSSGVPRSNTALYILSSPTCSQPFPKKRYSKGERFIRDVFLSLGDLECMRVRSEVDRPPCTAHLAADRAHTKLIRHWCAGLDRESHGPTVTTSLELDWHDLSSRKRGL
jgi:hypothetical protein